MGFWDTLKGVATVAAPVITVPALVAGNAVKGKDKKKGSSQPVASQPVQGPSPGPAPVRGPSPYPPGATAAEKAAIDARAAGELAATQALADAGLVNDGIGSSRRPAATTAAPAGTSYAQYVNSTLGNAQSALSQLQAYQQQQAAAQAAAQAAYDSDYQAWQQQQNLIDQWNAQQQADYNSQKAAIEAQNQAQYNNWASARQKYLDSKAAFDAWSAKKQETDTYNTQLDSDIAAGKYAVDPFLYLTQGSRSLEDQRSLQKQLDSGVERPNMGVPAYMADPGAAPEVSSDPGENAPAAIATPAAPVALQGTAWTRSAPAQPAQAPAQPAAQPKQSYAQYVNSTLGNARNAINALSTAKQPAPSAPLQQTYAKADAAIKAVKQPAQAPAQAPAAAPINTWGGVQGLFNDAKAAANTLQQQKQQGLFG